MTRDHYKGIPKMRRALLDADGNLEALEKGGELHDIYGSATLSAGTVTVTGTSFTADGYAFVSTKHPYPADEGINWWLGDGILVISGSNAAAWTVAYHVVIP